MGCYVDERILRGEVVKMDILDTTMLVVGDVHYIEFSTSPQCNGRWKIVEVETNKSVTLEREKTIIRSRWLPQVTRIDYKK